MEGRSVPFLLGRSSNFAGQWLLHQKTKNAEILITRRISAFLFTQILYNTFSAEVSYRGHFLFLLVLKQGNHSNDSQTKSGWIRKESTLIFVWRHYVEQALLPQGNKAADKAFPVVQPAFCSRRSLSAMRAMNSLFVGLPLWLFTV